MGSIETFASTSGRVDSCFYVFRITKQKKKHIMKAAIATLLMILLVKPQFINASPVRAPNIECDLDPDLPGCDPSKPKPPPTTTTTPPINGACRCNGHLSPVADPEIKTIGECQIQHPNGKGFFCYVDVGGSCCEDVSDRYTNHCVNYSICKTDNAPGWRPSISG